MALIRYRDCVHCYPLHLEILVNHMTRPKPEQLVERLEKATGPDRNLDFAIHEAFFPMPQERITPNVKLPEGFGKDAMSLAMDPRPSYTASLDAAIVLVERVLPEANCYGVEKDPRSWTGYVSRNNVDNGHWLKEAEHKTAPMALLLALLRALRNDDKERGDG